MKVAEQFTEFLEVACEPGQTWARAQLRLGKPLEYIWWDCPDGAWIAYWLVNQRKVPYRELQAIRDRQSSSHWSLASHWSTVFLSGTPDARAYADTLRAAFTMTGTRRHQHDDNR